MKTYKKTHSNKTALKNHAYRIKQRGGVCTVNDLTVNYHFPEKKGKKKIYDTEAKRIKFVRKKGNIITFKKPFRWMGSDYSQIAVTGFEKQRGSVKVVGFGRDTPWYKSMNELLDSIDWDLMEGWHAED